jgi:hypothetical protein
VRAEAWCIPEDAADWLESCGGNRARVGFLDGHADARTRAEWHDNAVARAYRKIIGFRIIEQRCERHVERDTHHSHRQTDAAICAAEFRRSRKQLFF